MAMPCLDITNLRAALNRPARVLMMEVTNNEVCVLRSTSGHLRHSIGCAYFG
jgi:hypothetical protein